ncbi:hypothetical protein H5410_044459 [Solanum commersonii]|uniref:Uncharacterized protein n=1 Tax=Solanum commersonii TaxID=4109 RepID=A0A9J5X6V9_SOLCO|nr:hypothetical protein H5410_044459 [Solanum commersonii]
MVYKHENIVADDIDQQMAQSNNVGSSSRSHDREMQIKHEKIQPAASSRTAAQPPSATGTAAAQKPSSTSRAATVIVRILSLIKFNPLLIVDLRRGGGRPNKYWGEVIMHDMSHCNLSRIQFECYMKNIKPHDGTGRLFDLR